MNIKSRKFTSERCSYIANKGDFCSRHYKNPTRFQLHDITNRLINAAKKIQSFWKSKTGFKLYKERGPAFFVRSICHNDSEIASFEPLNTIPRDYFFAIKDSGRFWGFDIRTLLVQYEAEGKLENPYTKLECDALYLERFRKQIDFLRKWKKPIHYEMTTGLTTNQSWNLRILDMCLKLDTLGYRIATQWFSDLDILQQKRLYNALLNVWKSDQITDTLRETIVPDFASRDKVLFKWGADKIFSRAEMDSVRRTNLNIIERLISSATLQSDRTLGAMYSVMSLCQVSHKCRTAYPWLIYTTT